MTVAFELAFAHFWLIPRIPAPFHEQRVPDNFVNQSYARWEKSPSDLSFVSWISMIVSSTIYVAGAVNCTGLQQIQVT